MIKWFFTFLMFAGACLTALQISYFLGAILLFLGNLCWAIYWTIKKDLPASVVFYVMTATWSLGIIKHLT